MQLQCCGTDTYTRHAIVKRESVPRVLRWRKSQLAVSRAVNAAEKWLKGEGRNLKLARQRGGNMHLITAIRRPTRLYKRLPQFSHGHNRC